MQLKGYENYDNQRDYFRVFLVDSCLENQSAPLAPF